ncbi:MAG TPA: hypothetical protein VGM30_10635 [Puia sp.]|jgi:hypothetical protein
MKAILIDPAGKTIKYVHFELTYDFSGSPMEKALGGPFSHEEEFENGDTMYTMEDADKNTDYLAFMLSTTGQVVYGKSVIIGFNKRDQMGFANCHFSLKQVKDLVVFCDAEETKTLREVIRFFPANPSNQN